jgi:hypothetical protein
MPIFSPTSHVQISGGTFIETHGNFNLQSIQPSGNVALSSSRGGDGGREGSREARLIYIPRQFGENLNEKERSGLERMLFTPTSDTNTLYYENRRQCREYRSIFLY